MLLQPVRVKLRVLIIRMHVAPVSRRRLILPPLLPRPAGPSRVALRCRLVVLHAAQVHHGRRHPGVHASVAVLVVHIVLPLPTLHSSCPASLLGASCNLHLAAFHHPRRLEIAVTPATHDPGAHLQRRSAAPHLRGGEGGLCKARPHAHTRMRHTGARTLSTIPGSWPLVASSMTTSPPSAAPRSRAPCPRFSLPRPPLTTTSSPAQIRVGHRQGSRGHEGGAGGWQRSGHKEPLGSHSETATRAPGPPARHRGPASGVASHLEPPCLPCAWATAPKIWGGEWRAVSHSVR